MESPNRIAWHLMSWTSRFTFYVIVCRDGILAPSFLPHRTSLAAVALVNYRIVIKSCVVCSCIVSRCLLCCCSYLNVDVFLFCCCCCCCYPRCRILFYDVCHLCSPLCRVYRLYCVITLVFFYLGKVEVYCRVDFQ
jgi:hypothetical protein